MLSLIRRACRERLSYGLLMRTGRRVGDAGVEAPTLVEMVRCRTGGTSRRSIPQILPLLRDIDQ
jgi:hypothetical protein